MANTFYAGDPSEDTKRRRQLLVGARANLVAMLPARPQTDAELEIESLVERIEKLLGY